MLGVWLVAGGLIYLWTRLQRGTGKLSTKIVILPLAVWSMSLAHIGAGVLTLGAVAETAFRTETAVALAPGEGIAFAGRRVTLLDVGSTEGPNYSATRANFRVDQTNGASSVSAERRYFTTSPMPTTEVGILSGFDGDLYLTLAAVRGSEGAWTVRLYHNPLVQFIFIGVILMALGGALSLVSLTQTSGGMSLVVLLLAAATPAAIGDPAQETRAQALDLEIRCVQCENEPIAQSTAEIAGDMRALVRERIAAGDSGGESAPSSAAAMATTSSFAPPFDARTWALWAAPLLLGGAGLATISAGRRRRRAAAVDFVPEEGER